MTDEAGKIILQVFAEWRHSFDKRLDEMGLAIDQAVRGLGELKANQRVHGTTLDRVLEQTTTTNGRMTAAEKRIDLIERREIREDAIADGRAEQRDEYRGRVKRAWDVVWSPASKAVVAVGLFTAGYTFTQMRDLWRW